MATDQTTNLSIVLSAKDGISGILGNLKGAFSSFGDGAKGAEGQLNSMAKAGAGASTALKLVGGVAAGAVAAGIAAIGIESVKSAANFQTMTTTLVTTAGESAKNIAMVRQGILNLSSATGTSAEQMNTAMYTIESAGYHAADGLTILKAAAQGAKTENADLAKVADAVTSSMRDYHLPADQAANVTSKLVAAVGAGKANFEDFTGALHAVLPIASAAHISINDILGSMASMTVHGISAQQASDNLANAIRTLQVPSQGATQYLAQIGITASDLADKLSSKGLSGTLQEISQAIMSKMGPSGKVLIDSFNQSKVAAQDAQIMIKSMPANLQTLANSFASGKISLADYRLEMKNLPTTQANLMQQFAALENRASGFNNLLKSGSPTALKYSQALQKATGNATTMNVALMLTGENADYTAGAVKKVGEAHAEAGNNVEGWALIQGNFNQQLEVAKNTLKNTGTTIGTVLLPAVTTIAKAINSILQPVASWIAGHQKLATIILGSIGVIAAVVSITLILSALWSKVTAAGAILSQVFLGVSAAQTAQATTAEAATVAQEGLNVAMDANPIGLIILAIGVLVVTMIYLYNHFKPVRDAVQDLWSFMKTAWSDIEAIFRSKIGIIVALMLPMIGIPLYIITNWKQVVEFMKTAWSDIENVFRGRLAVLAALILPFIGMPLLIMMNWQKIVDFFKTLFNDPAKAWQEFVNGIKNLWDALVQDAANWGTNLINAIGKGIQKVGDIIGKWIDNIGDWFKKGWDRLKANAPQWGRDLVHWIEEGIMDLAMYDISSVINWKNSAVKAYQSAFKWGKDLIHSISTGAVSAYHEALSWGEGVLKAAQTGFTKTIKAFPRWGTDIIHGIVEGLKSAWHNIESFFTSLPKLLEPSVKKAGSDTANHHVNGMSSTFKDVSKMKKIGEDILKFIGMAILAIVAAVVLLAVSLGIAIINGLIAGVKAAIKALTDSLSWIMNEIKKFFSSAGSWLWDAGKSLMDGFVKGIENGASKVYDSVKNIGSKAVNSLKSNLKIFSPSRVFAEIGENVSLGMAQGITNSSDAVAASTKSILPTVQLSGNRVISGTATNPNAQSSQLVHGNLQAQPASSQTAPQQGMAGNIVLNVNVGAYAGQPGELNQLATVLWQQIQVIARQHNLAGNLPNIGVRPL